ncbi:conserved hypothetical protein [Myxococcus xanthus DK 1622]|uniref:Uncharacterized protein n=1 Tax=Myxococcus xanthus (strain DK1622) TaxID=246197 RepID=Q1CVI3_MYXXD|nr:conserved hypothetical protein [Myxococcus xanthus DK 1622]
MVRGAGAWVTGVSCSRAQPAADLVFDLALVPIGMWSASPQKRSSVVRVLTQVLAPHGARGTASTRLR